MTVPDSAGLRAVGTDQVTRAREFVKRHPHISITTPRQNGTGEFVASWTEAATGAGEDGVVQKSSHYLLRCLMDWLEEKFDGEASRLQAAIGLRLNLPRCSGDTGPFPSARDFP